MNRAELWVHPNLGYMGGEYDEETKLAYLDGEWCDRVERSVAGFDGDTIAVTTLKEFEGENGEVTPWDNRTEIPYGFGMYDEVIEDGDYGALPEETIRDLADEYDHITVCGGFLNDCLGRFVDTFREYDEESDLTVDLEKSYVQSGGLARIDAYENNEDRLASGVTPRAAEDRDAIRKFRERHEDQVELKGTHWLTP